MLPSEMVTIVEQTDSTVVAQLEPACRELHSYHGSIAPTMASLPLRESDECWLRKQRDYERWLAEDGKAFVLLAMEQEVILGYALIRSAKAYDGWSSDEDVAMLEALSVLPDHRGNGIGHLLMTRVAERLQEQGIGQLKVQVINANASAQEFYAKHRFVPAMTEMFAHVADIAKPAPADETEPSWVAQYELQVSSWIYTSTQAILSRMAMLVATDTVFLALTLRSVRSAATLPLAYIGAALLVLAILTLLWGSRPLWGMPVQYAREGRRPLTLDALAKLSAERADWISEHKAWWLHLGAALTAAGVVFTGAGFLVKL
jgi:GNAT superfamily N-acetyltransferase